jgi:hypothetical protein
MKPTGIGLERILKQLVQNFIELPGIRCFKNFSHRKKL